MLAVRLPFVMMAGGRVKNDEGRVEVVMSSRDQYSILR
jgi:hypothetical protein